MRTKDIESEGNKWRNRVENLRGSECGWETLQAKINWEEDDDRDGSERESTDIGWIVEEKDKGRSIIIEWDEWNKE